MAENPQSRKNNVAVKEAIAAILMYEIADPRLQTLTINSVVVSRDRSVARVYVLADRIEHSQALEGLESAKGRIRSLLGARLGWRNTPRLTFFLDPMLEHTAIIEAVLRDAPATMAQAKDEDGYPILDVKDWFSDDESFDEADSDIGSDLDE
ncbi:MAG: 30S ribosome-binding factor RbfA [Coriobacteriales bacterium]|jgi:ribosome-binding factor A|nr:30S ribosome-binding factor RbfA [Coriobacteriales bacterium]